LAFWSLQNQRRPISQHYGLNKYPRNGVFFLTLYIQSGIFTVEEEMKNKFGKQCCYCGCYVSAGEGRCWFWDEVKKWFVACEDCFQDKKEERKNKT